MLLNIVIDLFDLTASVSETDTEYAEALRERMQATSELVSAFVRMNGQSQVSPMGDEVSKTTHKVQTEVLFSHFMELHC